MDKLLMPKRAMLDRKPLAYVLVACPCTAQDFPAGNGHEASKNSKVMFQKSFRNPCP